MIFLKKINLLVLLLLISFSCYCQETILTGSIFDANKNSISYGVITLKNNQTHLILGYTNINEDGSYHIAWLENYNTSYLEVNALGYEKLIFSLKNIKPYKTNTKNFILKEKEILLDEVVIKSKTVIVKNDTITYSASKFIQGNEANVEDLLRKIPGITIEEDGKIKYGKREIEKVMIDNDDLLNKSYKILTQNMPVTPVKEIEILQDYNENSLLKGIEKTNAVALNLKLDDAFKRLWFGNVKTNTSIASANGFYNFSGNLMNFGKRSKHYVLANFNNTGFETTGDAVRLLSTIETENNFEKAETDTNTIISLNIPTTVFESERTNFNNAKLFGYSSIFNLSKQTKLKVMSFLEKDKSTFFKNNFSTISTEADTFAINEKTNYVNNTKDFFGKLELATSFSPKKDKILLQTSFKSIKDNSVSELLFNNVATQEDLNTDEAILDMKFQYTNRLSKKKVFLVEGDYLNTKTTQEYNINQFFYASLFPDVTDIDESIQISNLNSSYANFKVQFLNRKNRKNYLKLIVGNKYEFNDLETNLDLIDNDEELSIKGFSNNLNVKVNDLYVKGTYNVKVDGIEIKSKLNFHYINSVVDKLNTKNKQNSFFYVNPFLDVEWKMSRKDRLILNYTYNTAKTDIKDLYDSYINTTFRNFTRGVDDFSLLSFSKIALNFSHGNPEDTFIIDSGVSYQKNNQYFSENLVLNQNFNLLNKVILNDRTNFNLFSQGQYYFSRLSSNLKLNLGYGVSTYQNIIDSTTIRDIHTQDYTLNLEFRSAFTNDFINYHLGVKLNESFVKSTNNFSYLTNISFLNIYFNLDKKISLDVKSTLYNLNSDFSKSNVFFLDANLEYEITKYNMTLGLVGKNLLDVRKYNEVTITDNLFSVLDYELLPRYVLLRLDYNF